MTKRTAVDISPTQSEILTRIASEVGALSRSGPTHGQPSWRVMLKGIADGTFRVYAPGAKRDPERGGKAKKKARIPGTPDWWRPFYGNAMGQEHAIKVSGLTLAELTAIGLRVEFNRFLTHPEVLVGKPGWPAPWNPKRPHWWWMPDEGGTMDADDAVVASGMTLDELTAAGLVLDDSGCLLSPPAGWRGWGNAEGQTTAETSHE